MLLQTPRAISEAITSLCDRLVPGTQPLFVPVTQRGDGVPNECFATVAAQVAEFGGALQHGWAIWEWPKTMIEAEFHAVWRDTDGNVLDVTPRFDAERRVLFLPDPVRMFRGVSVNNVRVALRDDPRIHEFISLADKRHAVLNSGERAHQFGLVSVPKEEIAPILVRMRDLQLNLARHHTGRNAPCPCGSGAKFKKCCGGE